MPVRFKGEKCKLVRLKHLDENVRLPEVPGSIREGSVQMSASRPIKPLGGWDKILLSNEVKQQVI